MTETITLPGIKSEYDISFGRDDGKSVTIYSRYGVNHMVPKGVAVKFEGESNETDG